MADDAPRAPAIPARQARRALPARHARGAVPARRSSSCSRASGCSTSTSSSCRGQFWRILAVTEAAVAIEIGAALWVAFRLVAPGRPVAARRAHAARPRSPPGARWPGLPLDLIRYARGLPVAAQRRPDLGLPRARDRRPVRARRSSSSRRASASCSPTRCSCASSRSSSRCARWSSDVSCDVPDGTDLGRATRAAALAAARRRCRSSTSSPASRSSGSRTDNPSLRTLGVGVLVALGVAFTISFELSLLLLRSIVGPIQDLQARRPRASRRATSAPACRSSAATRPGRLAGSFNQMVAGLEERERLREAFGAFVDPGLAERVLAEGTSLEGEEVEVTVLFVDIRDFTAFAERASAREVVAELNRFYDYVVPLLGAPRRPREQVRRRRPARRLRRARPPRRPRRPRGRRGARDRRGRRARRYGGELDIGIGINSGTVVSGTVGGGGRSSSR